MVTTRHHGAKSPDLRRESLRERLRKKLQLRRESAAAKSPSTSVSFRREDGRAGRKRTATRASPPPPPQKKRALLSAVTTETDNDRVISEQTMRGLRAAAAEKRKGQRITAKIREKEGMSQPREEEEDKAENEEENAPVSKFQIKVGSGIPDDGYTLMTRTDPYSNEGGDAVFVGVQPKKGEETVPLQVRFDSNYVFTVSILKFRPFFPPWMKRNIF